MGPAWAAHGELQHSWALATGCSWAGTLAVVRAAHPVPISVPDGPIQPLCLGVFGATTPIPARVFAGLPARSWMSVVGAAPQPLVLTCHCPRPCSQWLPQLTSALPGWSHVGVGQWVGLSQDPGPRRHEWEGGHVRGGSGCGAPGAAPRALTPEQQEPLGETAGAHVRARCHPAKACRLTTGTRISMEITGSNSFPLTGAV